MSSDPIRAALERLVELDDGCTADHWHAAITAARAALDAATEGQPSDQEIADVFSQGCRDLSRSYEPPFLGGARAIFARWGRTAVPPAPLEGEVGDLVEWLHAKGREGLECGLEFAQENGRQLTRAATLLSQLSAAAPAVVPIPVSEQPWKLPGWCDGQGRCWLQGKVEGDWRLLDPINTGVPQLRYCFSHSLPAHALPLPAPQGGEAGK